MKAHYSISELCSFGLELLPNTARGIQKKAEREAWPFIEVAGKGGRGGKRREYTPPSEILNQIRNRQLAGVLAQADMPPLPALPSEQAAPAGCTEKQRQREGARLGVLSAVERLMTETGVGRDAAITTLLTQAKLPQFGHIAQMLALALDERGRADSGHLKLPSSRTVKRWFVQREQNRLLPKAKAADMVMPDWLPVFLKFYRLPQKPSVAAAYEAFQTAFLSERPLAALPSIHAVRRALGKLGSVAREDGRRGKRDLKNILPFKRREFLHLAPAAVYTADGHTFDAEVLNPLSGKPFRPEITTVVDVATRRCMGWSVGLAESRFTVLEALCHASRTAIGALWYVDWGKGFENVMMTDEATGILGRLGTTMSHSRAYNSQAKGASERSHNIFTRAAKKLPTYVGRDMDDEARQAVFRWTRKEIRLHGKVVNSPIPTWDGFKAFIEAEIEAYNNRPHRSLLKITDADGVKRYMTPNEMWALKVAEFGEPPRVMPEDEAWLFRPQEVRTVQRGEIHLFNNVYFAAALEELHGETVRVGYDVQDAQWVWLYDDAGRFICRAEWHGNSQSYMPESVLAQAFDKRVDAAVQRLEAKRQNIEAQRPAKVLEHQERVDLGGLVLDMAQLKERRAAILAAKPERCDDAEAVVVEAAPKQVEGWQVPDDAQGRFALYQRLLGQDDLPEAAQRWLVRYPQSSEFRALSKRFQAV